MRAPTNDFLLVKVRLLFKGAYHLRAPTNIDFTVYNIPLFFYVGNQLYAYGTHFNISYNELKVPYDSYEESNEYTNHNIEYEYFDEEKPPLKIEHHKIFSYLSGTSCYKLKQMNLKQEIGLGSHDHMALKIDFDESLGVNELPNVELYLTSEGNSHGVIFNEWMDGDDLKFVFHKVCELHMFSSDELNTIEHH